MGYGHESHFASACVIGVRRERRTHGLGNPLLE